MRSRYKQFWTSARWKFSPLYNNLSYAHVTHLPASKCLPGIRLPVTNTSETQSCDVENVLGWLCILFSVKWYKHLKKSKLFNKVWFSQQSQNFHFYDKGFVMLPTYLLMWILFVHTIAKRARHDMKKGPVAHVTSVFMQSRLLCPHGVIDSQSQPPILNSSQP